jgi:hypothetical protein
MAIQGIQNINIGLPNESAGSDSLFTAFNKAQTNFTNLFDTASPVPIAGAGVSVQQVSNSVVVSANLVAGNNVILTTVDGAIVIDSLGDPANGTITGIIAGTGLAGGGFSDNVTVSLANSGVASGTYSNPTVIIDSTGRITQAANGTAGTVTSVSVSAGSGIQISGSPITTAGTITVTNSGVTRVNAGTGITVSGQTGNVTVSAAPVSAVTSVGVTSSTLTVSGTPVVSSGTITVNIPTNTTVTLGNVVTSNITANSVSITRTANAVGAGATVGASSILTVSSAFGSSDPNSPASAQGLRGRITGANLTGNSNYLTGVTGQYLITGTNASDFIKAGVLGVVGDQTTTADAAVVAYLDGDGGLTTAAAAYGVSMKNSTGGSGFDYGLDLQWIDLGLVGLDVPFKQADIRFNNGVELVANTANAVSINANVTVGIVIKSTAALYSALPSATTTGAGSRAFITDGNLVAAGNFGAEVSGSGANNVPVYSDGTNWRIG